MFKTINIILSFLMILTLTACGEKNTSVNNYNPDAIKSNLSNGKIIVENDNYALEWSKENGSVNMLEKTTNFKWSTTPSKDGEPQFDELGMPIKKHPMLQSAVLIEYLNNETDVEEQAVSYTSVIKEGKINTQDIEDGIRVEYYFDDVEIMVPVNYVLRDDSLEVSILTKDIQENSKKIISVSLLPFWCSAENDSSDSYLFFPSGSGALISTDTQSQSGVLCSAEVYGADPVMRVDDNIANQKAVRLPVYGAKSGDFATCAIIESGAESANIEANVGSSSVGFSGIYSKFQLRGYCYNSAEFMNGDKRELNIYSEKMIDEKIIVGYYPLKHEEANYVGFANVYRNYLNNKFNILNNQDYSSVNLSFVGGKMISKAFLGVPYKGILATTTVNQVQKILEENIWDKTKVNVRLIGFGTTGIDDFDYCGGYGINKSIGTLEDLSKLQQYCSQNEMGLFFDFDLIKVSKGNGVYSKYFDVAYNSLDKIADLFEYDITTRSRIEESKYHLLKRNLLSESSDKLLKKIDDFNISGISLETLSNVAYSDYSSKDEVKYYSKGCMAKDIQNIFQKFSRKYSIASSDANEYAAVMSDVIFDSPVESNEERIFEHDIPFYQMVFKGNIPLSAGSINTSANPDKHFLKAIESGSSLEFSIISDYSNKLINHSGNEFFSSRFSDIKTEMFDMIDASQEYYKSISGSHIVGHTIINDFLRETVFSNGVKVFVNYSDKELDTPVGKVAAKGFVWRKTQ